MLGKMDIASITPSPEDGDPGEVSRQKPSSLLSTQPHSPASTPAPHHLLPGPVTGLSEGFARKRKCFAGDEEEDKENSETEAMDRKKRRHNESNTSPFGGSYSGLNIKHKELSSCQILKEVQTTEQQTAFDVPSTDFGFRKVLSGSTTPVDRPSTPTNDPFFCAEAFNEEPYLTELALTESQNDCVAENEIQPIKTPVFQTPVQSPFNSPSRYPLPDPASPFLHNRLLTISVNPEPTLDDTPPPNLPDNYLLTWSEFTEERIKDYEKEAHLTRHRLANYLNKHPALNKPIRWMVVNWMHQVAHEHRLKRQTFHLAVNFLDIMLSKGSNVQRDVQFQLLGVVALLFASKMEEEQPPLIETLCEFVSDENDIEYERNMREARIFIFQKEHNLFQLVDWDPYFPSAHNFLISFFQQVHVYARECFEADPNMPAWSTQNFDTMRIATVPFVAASTALADAVADYDSIKFKNSVLAAATFHLAYCKTLPNRSFEFITGYSPETLDKAIAFMKGHYENHNPDISAIFPKYEHQEDYDVISHLSLPSKTLEEMEIHWQKRDKGEI